MNNLIYDRTEADVTYAKAHQSDIGNLKGTYNYTDLNRIEEWCVLIATELTNSGYSVSITTKTDWTINDFPTQAQLERIRSNVATLKNAFFSYTNVPANVKNMTYQKANDLEKVLNEIWNNLYGTENYYVYSGVARAGQRRLWQNRFRRLWKPKEDLLGTGTQWIDTGVVATNTTKLVIDYQFLEIGNKQFGCGDGTDTQRFCVSAMNNYFNLALGVAGNTTVPSDTNRHTFILDAPNKLVYVDNTSETRDYSSLNSYYPIAFFCRRNSYGTDFIHNARFYSAQIYDNDTLIRDFIPVFDENGEPCLLDRVSGVFYYNQGTGTFG